MATLRNYVHALRPWSFSASLTPVAVGAALAWKAASAFDAATLLASGLTAVSVHAAGNVVNTYYDYERGVDQKRRSDDRTLVDRILTPDDIVRLGVLLYTLGCAGFLVTAWLSAAKMEQLALVYFGGLSSSFLYTGGIGLKYIALGDVLVLVTFGPLVVLFSFMAQAGRADAAALLYAAPLALIAEAVLHANNSRDAASDREAGAVTLAILCGSRGSHLLYGILLLSPYVVCAALGLHYSACFLLPLITLPIALRLERQCRRGGLERLPRETAWMGLQFGTLYFAACVFADRAAFPFLEIHRG